MRRKLVYRWLFYSGATLLFLFLQGAVLNRISVWNVHPFLLPSLSAVAAAFESRRESFIFSVLLGCLCDLVIPGPIPCFYLLVLALCALLSSLVSRRLIVPGFFCSLVCAAGATVLCSLLYGLFFSYTHSAAFVSVARLTFHELILTLPFFLLVHFLFQKIHRIFQRD